MVSYIVLQEQKQCVVFQTDKIPSPKTKANIVERPILAPRQMSVIPGLTFDTLSPKLSYPQTSPTGASQLSWADMSIQLHNISFQSSGLRETYPSLRSTAPAWQFCDMYHMLYWYVFAHTRKCVLVWRDNLWESVTASEDRRMGVVSWVATFSVCGGGCWG